MVPPVHVGNLRIDTVEGFPEKFPPSSVIARARFSMAG
jgi:hypothetical protein